MPMIEESKIVLYRPAHFSFDPMDDKPAPHYFGYQAYAEVRREGETVRHLESDSWNGWGQPYFPFESAKAFIDHDNQNLREHPPLPYDPEVVVEGHSHLGAYLTREDLAARGITVPEYDGPLCEHFPMADEFRYFDAGNVEAKIEGGRVVWSIDDEYVQTVIPSYIEVADEGNGYGNEKWVYPFGLGLTWNWSETDDATVMALITRYLPAEITRLKGRDNWKLLDWYRDFYQRWGTAEGLTDSLDGLIHFLALALVRCEQEFGPLTPAAEKDQSSDGNQGTATTGH